MNPYRQRVLGLVRDVLAQVGPVDRALDYGSGDGWFARELVAQGVVAEVVAVDVQPRPEALVPARLYDGVRLPFAEREFLLSYAIDVLHHCPDPAASLRDLLRVTGRHLLLKDHTCRGSLGWLGLCVLDELGNRRFGIPSRYRYQRGWEWLDLLKAEGFEQVTLIHPARVHVGLLGAATNAWQFVGLWSRRDP